jgi:hypothetical protein
VQQLRAVHRYRAGLSYYEANKDAFANDARGFSPGFPGLSLRSPFLFWIWGMLPAVSAIVPVAWLLVSLTMVTTYLAAARCGASPLEALWLPACLSAYCLYPFTNYFMLLQDLWGTLLLLSGAALFFVGPRFRFAAALLCLCGFYVREFHILFVVLAMFATSRGDRKLLALWAAGLVSGILLYVYNSHETVRVLEMKSTALSERISWQPAFAWTCVRFGSVFIIGRDCLLPLLFLGQFAVWQRSPLLSRAVRFYSAVLLLLFCFLGNGGAHYAFNLVPLTLFGAALALASTGPQDKVEPDRNSFPQ